MLCEGMKPEVSYFRCPRCRGTKVISDQSEYERLVRLLFVGVTLLSLALLGGFLYAY